MTRIYPMCRTLLAALVLPLLMVGCAVSPPVRTVHPPAPLEAPAMSPAVAPAAAVPVPSPPAAPLATGVEAAAAAAPAPVSELPPVAVAPAQGEGMRGIATYYAKRFNGRRTASGVPYDPDKLTAAHQALPFGTQVKVVNLNNGREVTVTVNDRCRKRSFPFIDLSRAAAQRLGFLGKGTAKVRIIPLSGGEP
jgi:rare lipoprotein A